MTLCLSLALCSLSIALAATPLCRRLAIRSGAVARHNHRAVHIGQIPKLGGGAIFLATSIPLLALAVWRPIWSTELSGLLLGGTVLFLTGTADDVRGLGCNHKLALQTLGAIVLLLFGFRVEVVTFPGVGTLPLGWASIPLTLLWMVGITNAINLIDGLDALAVGVALSAVALAGLLGFAHGHAAVAVVAATLVGALLGFLPYNLHPACIFMGDSGSLFLGFMVAWLTVAGARTEQGEVMLLVPLLSLGLPITDTLLAIVRRVRRGIHPFVADRQHIHHRLLDAGLSHPTSSLLMSLVSLLLTIAALIAVRLSSAPLCPISVSQLVP